MEPIEVPKGLEPNGAAWLSFGRNLVSAQGLSSGLAGTLVMNQAVMDITGSIGVGASTALGLHVPVVIFQSGEARSSASGNVPTVPSGAFGDAALSSKTAIIDNTDGGFGLAGLVALTLPTGAASSTVGEGAVTATGRIIADYNMMLFGAQASVGYKYRGENRPWPGVSAVGDELPWTVSMRLSPAAFERSLPVDPGRRQTWELALRGSLPLGPQAPFSNALLAPAIVSLADRIALGADRDGFVLAGVDVGLTPTALGTPAFRGMVAFGWAPRNHDKDGDGVRDSQDQCPEVEEDRDGFEDTDGCPEIDNDNDGVIDAQDACPLVPGNERDDPKTSGCPKEEPPATPAAPASPAVPASSTASPPASSTAKSTKP
jgi:hypothetical protein